MKNQREKNGGWETHAYVKDHPPHSQWWPRDTPQEVMDQWKAARARLRAKRVRAGTFAAKVVVYLASVAALPTLKERAHHLALWVAEFGDRSPLAITRVEIQAVLQRLEAAGKSVSFVRHMRSALSNFFTVMYPDERNPARAASVPRPKPPEPRAVPLELAEQIINAMPDQGRANKGQKRPTVSQSKVVLRLMMHTGWPQEQIRQLRLHDIRLEDGCAWLHPRRKGAGTAGETVPMLPEAIEALRAFLPFLHAKLSPSSLCKSWRRACTKLEREAGKEGRIIDLKWTSPYGLRHAFAERALMTGNLAGTQKLMLHSSSQQTLRYAKGAVHPQAAAVIAILAAKSGHQDGPTAKR